MSFLNAFSEFMKHNIDVVRITKTYLNGKVTESSSSIGSFKCIAYKGSQAERIVSEAIRTRVAMVAITEPTNDVQEKDIVTYQGYNYTVIAADNVGEMDDALVIALERLS